MMLACQMLRSLSTQELIHFLPILVYTQLTQALFYLISQFIIEMTRRTFFSLFTGANIVHLSMSASLLSLQDAFNLDGYPETPVIQGTCNAATFQKRIASCLDASMMFHDLETFRNCLYYQAVVERYVFGGSEIPNSLCIHNQSQAIQTFKTIRTTISSCLSLYCREDKQCTSDLQRNSAFGYALSPPSLKFPTIEAFDICSYVAPFAFLNADIGGVGVCNNPSNSDTRRLIYHASVRFTSPTGFSLA